MQIVNKNEICFCTLDDEYSRRGYRISCAPLNTDHMLLTLAVVLLELRWDIKFRMKAVRHSQI